MESAEKALKMQERAKLLSAGSAKKDAISKLGDVLSLKAVA